MKNQILALTLFFATSVFATDNDLQGSWDSYNRPTKMSDQFIYKMSDLPLSGSLSEAELPWSDTYMPSKKGGIAYRWANPTSDAWSYGLASLAQLKKMSVEQVQKLSPAEKFDIYMGRYDYPTVKKERARTSPRDKHWEGICHGWAPAALLHREPQVKYVTNSDGITIPFGSSDIKALLIYYYGKVDWDPSAWIGKRCPGGIFNRKGCRGVNPGTLHVILANQLGVMKRGFIADIDRTREIWNQPVYAFQSEVVGTVGVREVLVRTTMFYADELKQSMFEPQMQTRGVKFEKQLYKYSVEMDTDGNITGGTWYSDVRPGFLWQHELADFKDPYYGNILNLIQ
jgi:hypothetical protein